MTFCRFSVLAKAQGEEQQPQLLLLQVPFNEGDGESSSEPTFAAYDEQQEVFLSSTAIPVTTCVTVGADDQVLEVQIEQDEQEMRPSEADGHEEGRHETLADTSLLHASLQSQDLAQSTVTNVTNVSNVTNDAEALVEANQLAEAVAATEDDSAYSALLPGAAENSTAPGDEKGEKRKADCISDNEEASKTLRFVDVCLLLFSSPFRLPFVSRVRK